MPMSSPKPDLSLLKAKGFARCPRCREVIDASSRACRFCKAELDPTELQAAAATYRSQIENKSRVNDRRALIAAIASLIGTVVMGALWLFRRMLRENRGGF
jgi:predicted amidophosphoribosyltransferase